MEWWKRYSIKWVNTPRNHINLLDKTLMSKLIVWLCNKSRFKKATGVDTSSIAAKSDLASLKAKVDKIDVDKIKTVPVDFRKLSNVVNNEVVMKTVREKLVAKVNNIDTIGLVLKTQYDKEILDLEKEISDSDKKFIILVGLLKNKLWCK